MLTLFRIYNVLRTEEKQTETSSKPATDTEQKPAEDTSNTIVDISDDYLIILKRVLEVRYMRMPYKIKRSRKRQKMIQLIETKAEELFKVIIDPSAVAKFDDYIALALVYDNLAAICIMEKQQYFVEKYCTRVIQLLHEKESGCKAILIALQARYTISHISKSLNPEKHYELLIEILKLYSTTKEIRNNNVKPVDITTILGINKIIKDTSIELEIIHTMILDDLSNIYNRDPSNKDYYVTYMHNYLKEIQLTNTNLYKSYIFSSRVAELSKYFLKYNRMIEAHNHLAFATYIKNKWSKINLGHKCLDWTDHDLSKSDLQLSVLWARYARNLLRISKDKFLGINIGDETCQTSCTTSKSETGIHDPPFEESTNLLLFSYIEDKIKMSIPCITGKYVLSFSEGMVVLDILTKWLKKVEPICKSIMDFSNYYKILLCICKGYKYLICFQPNIHMLIELYNRQIEIIKEIKKMPIMLNKNKNDTCKLIWLELAITNNIVFETLQELLQNTDEKQNLYVSANMERMLLWSPNCFDKYVEYHTIYNWN